MKLTYLAPSIIPSRSANRIHVMKMCQAFAKNGHEVTLLAPYGTSVAATGGKAIITGCYWQKVKSRKPICG